MKRRFFIYGIFDQSGKCHYVGQTTNPKRREACHTAWQSSRFPKAEFKFKIIRKANHKNANRLNMNPDEKKETAVAPKEKYFYFVDGEKFESDNEFTTGAIIKSRLPEAKRGYALYLEGHGNEPDTLINEDTSISLDKEKGPKRFYTTPPASFGLS
jgi:predicted GIY-YIG superfamily endonuclease